MDLPKIKALIDLLHDSRLTALELSEDGTSIRLERHLHGAMAVPATAPNASRTATPATAEATMAAPPAATAATVATSNKSHIVTASMQGILHLTPAPGEAAFVQLGDRVAAEQVVCVIEAMKMFNTLETEAAGTVTEILAQSGTEIKAGQALFRIEQD
jgi:acetyl-CoA carboxylase biotin carboxyl carrier protein